MVLSFKEIQASLFIVYRAIAIIYKNSNQKHLQSGIQTKNMERKYKTEKWEIKKELENEQIRERNNFEFLYKPWSLETVNKEVKHFVYNKKKKFYFFPSACFQIVQSSFLAKPKYLHE